jgi:hypothetical protein
MNSNWNSEQAKLWFANFLSALEQTANRWSSGIFVLIKTIAALFGLIMLMAAIVVLTQWFITVYGGGLFVLTLILSSFALSVLTTMANKKP